MDAMDTGFQFNSQCPPSVICNRDDIDPGSISLFSLKFIIADIFTNEVRGNRRGNSIGITSTESENFLSCAVPDSSCIGRYPDSYSIPKDGYLVSLPNRNTLLLVVRNSGIGHWGILDNLLIQGIPHTVLLAPLSMMIVGLAKNVESFSVETDRKI